MVSDTKKGIILKRIGAYFIDILVVTFAASMLSSISYLNPQLSKYEDVYKEYVEIAKSDLSTVDANQILEINYRLERNNIYGTFINIVLILIYFVVFQKFNNGQTLGKKLLGIKIDGNQSLVSYLIRSLILHNVLINTLKVALILSISKDKYIYYSKTILIVELAIEVAIIVMIISRSDRRGLHDLIANTDVVFAEENKKCITD